MVSQGESSIVKESVYQGIPVSSGYVIGRSHRYNFESSTIIKKRLTEQEVEIGLKKLQKILKKMSRESDYVIKELEGQDTKEAQESIEVIKAQKALLQDKYLLQDVEKRVRDKSYNVEYVFAHVCQGWLQNVLLTGNHFFEEKINEILNTLGNVIRLLMSDSENQKIRVEGNILVAHELTSSQFNMIKQYKAFVTDGGAETSHVAIVARSMGLPAVMGLKNITLELNTGKLVIVDGYSGKVIINPSIQTIRKYRSKIRKEKVLLQDLEKIKEAVSETKDGHRIHLLSNIKLPEETQEVINISGEGVGLFRTEFLYMDRPQLPSRQEHEEVYSKMIQSLEGKSMCIRTFDLGADKLADNMEVLEEHSSALGLRAIRFCLSQSKLFKEQIRGILIASHYGDVRLMVPLICNYKELEQTLRIIEEVKESLDQEKIPYNPKMPVGVMIETPSSCLIADHLIDKVDFFSIGTNDLIQYTVAVDRENPTVAHLYDSAHPAVIRLIHQVNQIAQKSQKPCTVCGEMASEEMYLILLIILGITSVSVAPGRVLKMKSLIRKIEYQKIKNVLPKILAAKTGDEVRTILRQVMKKL